MQAAPWAGFSSALAVVPSDSTIVNCRAIYVGGAGNVAVSFGPEGAQGTPVVFTAPPVGSILPVNLSAGGRIMATGTTATLLLALA